MTTRRATKHEKKMRWLADNEPFLEAEYPGMWVAIGDDGLAGVGGTLREAEADASQKGVANILLHAIKSRDVQGTYLIRDVRHV